MDYDEFINGIPDETKELIHKAIEIYKVLENEQLFCVKYGLFGKPEKEKLSKTDKRCASLFLAGLIVDTDVKKIMNDNDITFDDALEYFDKESLEIPSLNEDEYKKIYQDNFRLLMGQLCTYDDYRCYPELLIENLGYNHRCGSNIVEDIFKFIDVPGTIFLGATSTNAYNQINESLNQKLSKKKNQNEENINDMPEPFGIFGSMFSVPSKQKYIDKYGEFLTDKEYITNPAIGREEEIKNVLISLLTPDKSAILIGEAGVGKTAVVEGIAYLIQNKMVPKQFENSKIVKINTSSLVSGTRYRGDFEEIIENLLRELSNEKDVILFIDEIHTVIGAGSSSTSNNDLSNILKPYLDRGQIKMIGATTKYEYENLIDDSAFKRRFERINVLEPEEKITKKILIGTIPRLEEITKVKFNINEKDSIIDFIVNATNNKSRVYTDKVNNPDLALSILKKAFAYAAYNNSDELALKDIADAIANCDRLYETTRNKKAELFLEMFSNDAKNDTNQNECKIIELNIPHRK